MGCWNGTCGVSNLPITHGQKVRGFILVPNQYGEQKIPLGNGPCYSHDIFVPLSIGIRGEYNDYGTMENIIKDTNSKLILKYINKQIKDGKLKLTEGEDEKPKPFKKIDELVERICRSEELGFMMVLEDIYIASIEAFEANNDREYDVDRSLPNVIEDFKIAKKYVAETDAQNKLRKVLKGFKIKAANDDNDIEALRRQFLGWSIPKRPNASKNHRDNIASYFLKSGGGTELIDHGFILDHGKDLVIAKDIPAKMLAGHFLFCCAMSSLRKMWIPQCGQGSQSDEYKVHRLVAEATLKHIQKVKADIIENDSAFEDPEEREHLEKRF